MKESYIETHERDQATVTSLIDYTYCGVCIGNRIIRLGHGDEVTCPQCIEERDK